MYRDDHEAARARLDALLTRQEHAADEIRDRLVAIDALRRRLAFRALPPIDTSTGDRATLLAPQMKLSALVVAAGVAEARANELETELELVSRQFRMLSARVEGKANTTTDEPLAPAPRRVPLRYVFGEIVGGGWKVLKPAIMFPPVLLAPLVHPLAAIGTAAFVLGVSAVLARRRLALLRWGVPVEVEVIATRETGSDYTNWPIRVARGWDVTTERHTGTGELARLAYLGPDGNTHEIVVGERGYHGGVILADSREPATALPIEQFANPPRPDYRGAWSGHIGIGALLKSIVVTAYLVTMLLLSI
jgi:hypothetical protein